jgi:hypothetical protein
VPAAADEVSGLTGQTLKRCSSPESFIHTAFDGATPALNSFHTDVLTGNLCNGAEVWRAVFCGYSDTWQIELAFTQYAQDDNIPFIKLPGQVRSLAPI